MRVVNGVGDGPVRTGPYNTDRLRQTGRGTGAAPGGAVRLRPTGRGTGAGPGGAVRLAS